TIDDLSLDNIDEFVNDQYIIVTYKWLSLTLGVHVNLAKMLYHYLDRKRNESSALLHATYLVSGKFVNNDTTCHKVSLVQEDQLEVYSVQKAVLEDSGPLYSADYDAVKENLRNCSRYILQFAVLMQYPCPRQVQQAHEMTQAPPLETLHTKSGINGHSSLASKPTSKQSKGIMGMFANKNVSKNQEENAPVVRVSVLCKSHVMFISSKYALTEYFPFSSKSKRLDHSDSEEKENKRWRIKKPQSDSTDDKGKMSCKGRACLLLRLPSTFTLDFRVQLFHVTEKGYESESYSETEDDFKTSKPSQLNPDPPKPSTGKKGEDKRRKNVAASNKSTKQASIMGFFQNK
uniref:DNA polymerase delta subunit 3 n=1 Tax=Oncorhynchus mykiss TaxID=8022 RepID=A0A8K9UC96_ONCMY